jgi:glutathione S-transferase
MPSFESLPAFQPLVLFSVLLALKMGAVAFATARARARSLVVVNPEDVPVNKGSHPEAEDAPATLRAKRAHQNDVENIPVFLVLALLFTLTGCSATAGWAYFGVYFAARTLHTIFYLGAIQPWRTAAFALGQLTQLGILVQLLMKAF